MSRSEDCYWQCDKSLSACLGHLWSNRIFCDITFIIGKDKTEVYAHKLILISRSPVFYASIEGPLAQTGKIHITDIEKDTFELFLSYLYTDEITLTRDNVTSVHYCAQKYCVDTLSERCATKMENWIDEENVFGILEESHIYGLKDLQQKCLNFITQYTHESLFASESFNFICSECMLSVLKMNSLKISEEDLFKHVLVWAKYECSRQNLQATDENKRKVLGKLIKYIRFPAMPATYFKSEVANMNLLDADEVIDVFLYNFSKDDLSRRKSMFGIASRNYQRVMRYRKTLRERYPSDDVNEIAFESNNWVTLHGITVYTPKEFNDYQRYKVEIYDSDHVCLATVNESDYIYHSSDTKLQDILLPTTIEIEPNKKYTIRTIASHWTKCFYGTRGKSFIPFNGRTILIHESDLLLDEENDTTVERGQIPCLLLS